MPTSGLLGPFRLTMAEIDRAVTKRSAGVYALGSLSESTFNIAYIGRSDADVKRGLQLWVGDYGNFKFAYCDSPLAAFERECSLFHDFGGLTLESRSHPSRPGKHSWKCPRCAGVSSAAGFRSLRSY